MKIFTVLILIMFIIGVGYSSNAILKSTQEAGKKDIQKKVKCPVTGGTIDPAKAYAKTTYKGKTYYFCCAGCPEQFKKNPEKYIKK